MKQTASDSVLFQQLQVKSLSIISSNAFYVKWDVIQGALADPLEYIMTNTRSESSVWPISGYWKSHWISFVFL
jgi:hypothetical protein